MEDIFTRHGLDVSRETLEKFSVYARLLLKWQKAVNLVGPATLDDVPRRHFLDSAQILSLLPDRHVTLVDLGSGAGFPGMVLAIAGVARVHLVESDIRKATFLREVSRETSTAVTIHDKRAEDCRIPDIDVVTARALAPLSSLLGYMAALSVPARACGIFLKGRQVEQEIADARRVWDFSATQSPSLTDPQGRVVQVRQVIAKRCGT